MPGDLPVTDVTATQHFPLFVVIKCKRIERRKQTIIWSGLTVG